MVKKEVQKKNHFMCEFSSEAKTRAPKNYFSIFIVVRHRIMKRNSTNCLVFETSFFIRLYLHLSFLPTSHYRITKIICGLYLGQQCTFVAEFHLNRRTILNERRKTRPFCCFFPSTLNCFLLMPYKYLRKRHALYFFTNYKIDLHCYRSEVSIVLHANVFVYLCKDI